MVEYSRTEVAERAGVEAAYVDHLAQLTILTPDQRDRFSPGDVRRVLMVRALEGAGIPLEELGAAITRGELSLAFMDTASYERFSALSGETFAGLSARTGVPLQLLMVIREAIGSAQPSPDDRVREDELAIVPFIELQLQHGFRPIAIERLLRVQGDSLRRVAETEADWWRSEVIVPAMEAGKSPGEVANIELADQIGPPSEQAIMSIYHAQQAHAWTANIIEGFEMMLASAGVRSRLERPPAMCFLDITGYTRLTQERGDQAAAELAGVLARLVQRASVPRGGRPIKWLGDGVMFYFKDPGPGVLAALEMVDEVAGAGLPPAHVGLHAGPVLFQEGDYYGQTVNIASRIAEYARPGEVLVSEEVVAASEGTGASFTDIGPVELKGVSGV
ncbi:MAG: adenylate/guanylate cyclase domain-containing protein, partial [Chloroflexota bacterium]